MKKEEELIIEFDTQMAQYLGCEVDNLRDFIYNKYQNSYANIFEYKEFLKRQFLDCFFFEGSVQYIFDKNVSVKMPVFNLKARTVDFTIKFWVDSFFAKDNIIIGFMKDFCSRPVSYIICMTLFNRIIDHSWYIAFGYSVIVYFIIASISYMVIKLIEKIRK